MIYTCGIRLDNFINTFYELINGVQVCNAIDFGVVRERMWILQRGSLKCCVGTLECSDNVLELKIVKLTSASTFN